MRRLLHLVVSSLFLSGCFGPGEGVEVPLEQIYFPVGIALDAREGPAVEGDPSTHDHLLVVSSDFDLQYNGGAIQSYDLEQLAKALPTPCASDEDCSGGVCEKGLCATGGRSRCGDAGERSDDDRLLYPGLCNSIDPAPFQLSKVKGPVPTALEAGVPYFAP